MSLADSNASDCCVKMDAGQLSQLPYEYDRGHFNFWVVMLHDPIDMLRTIFYESDAILFTDAVNRNDRR